MEGAAVPNRSALVEVVAERLAIRHGVPLTPLLSGPFPAVRATRPEPPWLHLGRWVEVQGGWPEERTETEQAVPPRRPMTVVEERLMWL